MVTMTRAGQIEFRGTTWETMQGLFLAATLLFSSLLAEVDAVVAMWSRAGAELELELSREESGEA